MKIKKGKKQKSEMQILQQNKLYDKPIDKNMGKLSRKEIYDL